VLDIDTTDMAPHGHQEAGFITALPSLLLLALTFLRPIMGCERGCVPAASEQRWGARRKWRESSNRSGSAGGSADHPTRRLGILCGRTQDLVRAERVDFVLGMAGTSAEGLVAEALAEAKQQIRIHPSTGANLRRVQHETPVALGTRNGEWWRRQNTSTASPIHASS